MSKYTKLRQNPPQLTIKKGAREIVFTTISCMCDNVHYLTLKKNDEGDFKLSGNGHSINNWQMKHPKHDIEWEADSENWDTVIKMINSGTEVVESAKSR